MRPNSLAALALALVHLPTRPPAQDAPVNVTLVGQWSQPGQAYADVWGDGDFAYLAHKSPRVDIIDITNPAAPVLAAAYIVPPPDDSASAQDVKVGDGLLFIALDSDVDSSAQIVDVRDPYNPVKLTSVDIPGYPTVHNLFYADGWLYLADSFDPEVAIVDLRTYDPDNPPALINQSAYLLTGVGNDKVHDMTVVGDRLYCSAWDSLVVFDIANLGAQAPQELGSIPELNSHSSWATADNAFVVTAGEYTGGPVRFYEIVDGGTSVELVQRDSFFLPSTVTTSAHNPLIVGDRVFVSHYQAGLQVLEIDRNTKKWTHVASYDTSTEIPGGFEGNWGVYPFLGPDKVLVSDKENGLFILDVHPDQVLFAYPGGKPVDVPLAQESPVTVHVTPTSAGLDPSSVTLGYRVDGGVDVAVPMTSLGGGDFQANLPAVNCGSVIEWFVSADNASGKTFLDPPGASGHLAHPVTAVATVLTDDFEGDQGWTVQSFVLDTGEWERADPDPFPFQPGTDNPDGTGTLCFVTQATSPTGSYGDQDVDGGPTYLISPVLDLANDGRITYTRWYVSTLDDPFTVWLSNNGGFTWTLVDQELGYLGGWDTRTFSVSDFLAPTNQVQVRFGIADNPNDSQAEVIIDDVLVEAYACDPVGIVLTVDPLVGGSTARLIASGANPGQPVSYGYSLTGLGSGPCFFGGTVCLDLLNPVLLGSAIADADGIATLSATVPSNPPPIQVHVQAVAIAGAGSEVSNPVTTTLIP